MADETKTIRIIVDASKAVDGSAAATRALANLEKQTAGMGSTLDRMEGALGRVGGFLKAQLALMIAEIGTRFVGMAKGALDAAGGLDELAEQLGITARGLQALQLSAVQNGTKLEQLETGISKFSQKMGEASNGSKEMVEALNALGVKNLDLQGKLRPTEALLSDVAAKILAIEDPARRSAAMVDFFGKTGTKMLPMLKDMAGGLGFLAEQAQRAGAMISAETIAKLDTMGDRAAKSQLKLKALFAEGLAGPLTAALDKVNEVLGSILGKLKSLDDQRALAEQGILSDSDQAATRGRHEYWSAQAAKKENRNNAFIQTRADRARQAFENMTASAGGSMDAAERAEVLRRQNAVQLMVSGTFPVERLDPDGDRTSTVKGAGESEIAKYEKLIGTLDNAVKAQDAMTAAADRGDRAFRDQEVHAEALAKAVEIFGLAVSDADPRVAELEKRMRKLAEGKAATAFAQGTNALRDENEILAKQLELMNEAPEVLARETAAIKTKQQAQRDGIAIDSDRYKARLAESDLNEKLKAQLDQQKQAAELWSEPIKSAFRSVQQSAADAWENILTTGNFTFQSLGEVFKTTTRRMAAEFLSLATIRPIMTLAIESIGPGGLGLISGGTMAQMGVPSSGASGVGGSGIGSLLGGGMGGIFNGGGASGGGWLSRQFSGVSNWLGSPIVPDNGALAAGAYGPPAPGLGGLTWGQGLAGVGSIAAGGYGLLKGGQSTAGTIGSIGQIVGGTMMLIPGLQPFGAAISMLSSVLPGLFGDGPKIPEQPALAYGAGQFRPTGMGGFSYSGDSLGAGTPMNDAARQIAASLRKSFRAAGLSTVPGGLIGGTIASGVDHQLRGGQWQDRPYTQTGLLLPSGDYESLTYNDSSMDPQKAGEYLLAQTFRANVLRGGVSGAGAGLKQGLERINPLTAEDLDNVIAMGRAYDELGKATNSAKDGVDKLNAAIDDLKDFADRAGLAMEPINAELQKQTKRAAQDFIDQMLDPLAVQMRALEDERKSAIVSAEYIRDHIEGVYVDMDRIAMYYTNKEAALRDQFYAGGVAKLQAVIDRLTYGDLANASPTLQLSGTRGAYTAALAQAQGGDSTAIANLSGYAENYLNVARQNFASGPEYQALVQQIREALQELSITVTGGAGTTAAGQAATNTALAQQLAQTNAMIQSLAAMQVKTSNDLAEVTAQLRRANSSR